MNKVTTVLLTILALLALLVPSNVSAQGGQGDPYVLAYMQKINNQLKTKGLRLAIEEIDFFTIGAARPSNRIHQQEFAWVANDARRLADGDNITYLVDKSDGKTASGLSSRSVMVRLPVPDPLTRNAWTCDAISSSSASSTSSSRR